MNEHELILKLIEEVDPADTAKLDEIDARVWCWLRKDEEFKQFEGSWIRCQSGMKYLKPFGSAKYTRSRDQIKAIRPEGWAFDMGGFSGGEAFYEIHKIDENGNPKHTIFTPVMGVEELAELHAIIQAEAYERSQK